VHCALWSALHDLDPVVLAGCHFRDSGRMHVCLRWSRTIYTVPTTSPVSVVSPPFLLESPIETCVNCRRGPVRIVHDRNKIVPYPDTK